MHIELKQHQPQKFFINQTIPVLLKLDLSHYLSPIRVNVHYYPAETEEPEHHSSQMDSQILNNDNSLIFGSFTTTLPCETDHSEIYHNDHHFKIVNHESKDEVFPHKFFYLSIESPLDRFISICARSKYNEQDQNGLKKEIVPIMESKADPCEE